MLEIHFTRNSRRSRPHHIDAVRQDRLRGGQGSRRNASSVAAPAYENRNTADYHKLTLTLRALLFAQREGVI